MDGKTVFDTLASVQADIAVPKSRTNRFGGYSYRNAEDIMEALKPACMKHGAAFYVYDEIVEIDCEEHSRIVAVDKKRNTETTTTVDTMGRFYVKATAVFCACGDKIEVSAYAREAIYKKGMDDAQVTGSASSYARKYALCGLFGIDGQDDPDSMDNRESNSHEKKQADDDDALMKAKSEANDALKAYASRSGTPYKDLVASMKADSRYGDDPEFFLAVAEEYRSLM